MGQYFKVHPINPQLRLLNRAVGDHSRRRHRRVSHGLELRVWLAPRRQSGARARASIARHRARSRLHARMPRSFGYRDLCSRRELGISAPESSDARPVHVRAACHAAVAEASARPETALDRHSRARSHDRSGAARRARRAADELDAAACRTIRCRSRIRKRSAIGSSVRSMRSSTAGVAASSPPRCST